VSTPWTSSVSRVDGDVVRIRGYDLEELIGGTSFTASCFLLIRGRLPSPPEVRALDAVLNAVLDYALLKPGTVAARYAVSGNPSMTAGLATAILSVGPYTLAPEDAAVEIAEDARRRRLRIPGFGHPRFKRVDPRAQRLKEVAVEAGVWGDKARLYELIHRAFVDASGRPDIPINDVGMMAVVLLELGFTPDEMTGLAILSTFPGLIAHVSEELQTGRRIRVVPDDQVDYGDPAVADLAEGLRAAGWPSAGEEEA
jgi:citrate synthase